MPHHLGVGSSSPTDYDQNNPPTAQNVEANGEAAAYDVILNGHVTADDVVAITAAIACAAGAPEIGVAIVFAYDLGKAVWGPISHFVDPPTGYETWCQSHGGPKSPKDPGWVRWQYAPGMNPHYAAPPDGTFEAFADPIAAFASELWWNCKPTLDPRDVLLKIVELWNRSHSNVTQRLYVPPTLNFPPNGILPIEMCQVAPATPLIDLLEAVQRAIWHDSNVKNNNFTQGKGPNAWQNVGILVNTGPVLQDFRLTPGLIRGTLSSGAGASNSTSMSTPAKVATGAAVVAGGGLLTAAIVAHMRKESVSFVLGQAWKKTKGVFKR